MTWTPLFVALLVLVGALSLRNYLRVEVVGRARLMVVRVLAVGLLLLVLLAPGWVRPSQERLKPRLQIMVDASGSMDQAVRPGGESRLAAARATVQALRDHYGDAFEVAEFHFDVRLREGEAPEAPRTAGTDVSAALSELLGRGDARTRALFLVSDGRSTRGAPPMLAARSAPYPVHALGVGVEHDPRPNVALLGLQVPEEGFRDGDMVLEAQVSFEEVAPGTRIPLALHVDGELVQTDSLESTAGETTVQLRWHPTRGGLQALELRVGAVPGLDDRVREDDRIESSTRVRADPIPVLVLGGRPGPDLAFLRRVLVGDPRFEVRTVFGFSPERPVELPPEGDRFALGAVPLVVVSGFAAELFPASVMEGLVAYVERQDGALLLVSNGPREWKDLFASPLANMLPFATPSEFQPLEKRFAVDPAQVDGHPVTRILEHGAANQQAWQRLPPVAPGLRLVAGVGARVLLGQPYYPSNIPLVASRAVKGGLVVAVNSRELFLWNTLARAHGDPEEVHDRFWGRLAAWAADPGRAGGERLEVSRLRYTPGEALSVRWKGGEGMSPPSRVLLETLKDGAAVSSLTLGGVGGEASGELVAPGPGFYQLRAADGRAPPVPLAVHASREELRRPGPDHGALRRVAEASGGAFLSVTGAGPLEGLPPVDAAPVVRDSPAGIYWLDVPQVMVACLLLFCLEWGMRRRRNLV